MVTNGQAPRWYKMVVGLWGLISLFGGGLVAFYILQAAPNKTLVIGALGNLAQVILLGLLINKGLRYFPGRQLIKKFLLAFVLAVIVPIIFIFIDTGGEMPFGVLMFMVLVITTLPQFIFSVLYGLVRKFMSARPYLALAVSTIIHVLLFALVLNFVFPS